MPIPASVQLIIDDLTTKRDAAKDLGVIAAYDVGISLATLLAPTNQADTAAVKSTPVATSSLLSTPSAP